MIRLSIRPIPVSAAQKLVLESESWLTGMVTGRNGGKTKCGAVKILRESRDGEPGMVVSPDANMIRETTLPTFVDTAQYTGQYISHVTTPTPRVHYRSIDGGVASCVFKGAEKPDKLRGASVARLWIDEASIISKAAFEIAIACCRHKGVMGPVLATFTPRGFKHWTFEQFFEKVDDFTVPELIAKGVNIEWFGGRPYVAKKDTNLVHCSTRENPFAPPEFYDRIGQNYSSMLREQELEGRFIEISGLMFRREWFEMVDEAPFDAVRVRYWDKASTHGAGCYSAGVLLARAPNGIYYVEHVVRGQWGALERNRIMEQTAERDAMRYHGCVTIYIEQEGAGSGKEITDQLILQLSRFPVYRDLASASALINKGGVYLPGDAKIRRAMPLSAQCEAGNVRVVRGSWNSDWFDELCAFPEYAYCDQVDATSAGFQKLAKVAPDNLFAQRLVSPAEQRHYGQTVQLSDSFTTKRISGGLPWNQENSDDTTG